MKYKHKLSVLSLAVAAASLVGCGTEEPKGSVGDTGAQVVSPPGSVDRAPSIWFRYNDAKAGDIIMQDVYIPEKGLTPYTYYSVLNWNAGMEGGGYAGIQDHPDGRNFIFSIWDPSNGETITAPHQGPGTKVENFGGEGTGLKSWNFELGWDTDKWYTLVAKVWQKDGHTQFGYWAMDTETGVWTHLVTMDYPVENVYFNSPTGSFVEDWLGTGDQTRTGLFREGHKRQLDGSWLGFTKAEFSVIQEEATAAYNENYDATSTADYYRMSTGGSITPDEVEPVDTFSRPYSSISPVQEPVAATLTTVSAQGVSWTLNNTSTPLFKYTVLVDGEVVAMGENPSATQATFDAIAVDAQIEVHLESILGKTTVLKATVAQGQLASDDTITVDAEADALVSGEPMTIEALSKGESRLFEIMAIDSANRLKVELAGNNGDVDIYVKAEEPATPQDYDCVGYGGASLETCYLPINVRSETPYYILVVARTDASNVTLSATHDGEENGMLNSGNFIVTGSTPAQPGNDLKYAFDGDASTMWHTSWGDDMQEYPHEVVIDLGETVDVNRFEYTPRQDGGRNGTIVSYQIYVSESSVDYGEVVHAGTWVDNTNMKLEVFGPVTGRFVKFVALEERNGGAWASAAELRVGIDDGNVYEPIDGTGGGDGDGGEGGDGGTPTPEPESNTLVVNSTLLDNATFVASSTSPAQDGHELTFAFDGDTVSHWHTSWSDSNVVYPHEVIIDLGEEYQVNRFDYSPREGGGNGTVVEYEVYVSNDQDNFAEAVSAGSWADNGDTKTATFTEKAGRFVKFVALAERGGNPWASAGEFNVGVNLSTAVDMSSVSATSSSAAEAGHELEFAFDSDVDTHWHTTWSDASVVYPHEVTIDLGASHNVSQFDYTPRPGGGNGTVVKYEVYVSDSDTNFGEAVSSGDWPGNGDVKSAIFTPTSGRFVKFVALEEQGGGAWASAAEFAVRVNP
ncbi:discoidin domain-containing protein [Pseudoalteromonas sp. GB56]